MVKTRIVKAAAALRAAAVRTKDAVVCRAAGAAVTATAVVAGVYASSMVLAGNAMATVSITDTAIPGAGGLSTIAGYVQDGSLIAIAAAVMGGGAKMAWSAHQGRQMTEGMTPIAGGMIGAVFVGAAATIVNKLA